MDVSYAVKEALDDSYIPMPDTPLIGLPITTPDGTKHIREVRQCHNWHGYIINNTYFLGLYRAAELLGGSL